MKLRLKAHVRKATVDPELLNKIKSELREDLSRYDDDYSSWSEVVLDCPSDTLEQLYGQIPEADQDEYFEQHIVPYIRSLRPEEA